MADCDAAKDFLDQARADYDAAWWNEFNQELQKWGTGAGAAAATVGAAACWTGLEAVTLGAATLGCVAASGAAAGAWTAFAGYWGPEEDLETAREQAEWWLEEMETAYCFCLENGGFDEPPEPPTIEPAQPYDDEEWVDYPMDDDEPCCSE